MTSVFSCAICKDFRRCTRISIPNNNIRRSALRIALSKAGRTREEIRELFERRGLLVESLICAKHAPTYKVRPIKRKANVPYSARKSERKKAQEDMPTLNEECNKSERNISEINLCEVQEIKTFKEELARIKRDNVSRRFSSTNKSILTHRIEGVIQTQDELWIADHPDMKNINDFERELKLETIEEVATEEHRTTDQPFEVPDSVSRDFSVRVDPNGMPTLVFERSPKQEVVNESGEEWAFVNKHTSMPVVQLYGYDSLSAKSLNMEDILANMVIPKEELNTSKIIRHQPNFQDIVSEKDLKMRMLEIEFARVKRENICLKTDNAAMLEKVTSTKNKFESLLKLFKDYSSIINQFVETVMPDENPVKDSLINEHRMMIPVVLPEEKNCNKICADALDKISKTIREIHEEYIIAEVAENVPLKDIIFSLKADLKRVVDEKNKMSIEITSLRNNIQNKSFEACSSAFVSDKHKVRSQLPTMENDDRISEYRNQLSEAKATAKVLQERYPVPVVKLDDPSQERVKLNDVLTYMDDVLKRK